MNIHSFTFATACREMVPPQCNQATLVSPDATIHFHSRRIVWLGTGNGNRLAAIIQVSHHNVSHAVSSGVLVRSMQDSFLRSEHCFLRKKLFTVLGNVCCVRCKEFVGTAIKALVAISTCIAGCPQISK
jgi:hypothetical protein